MACGILPRKYCPAQPAYCPSVVLDKIVLFSVPNYSAISTDSRIQILQETNIFSQLEDWRTLAQLAQAMREASVPAAYTVFKSGPSVNQIYVVVSGELILQVAETTLAKLSRGACFGQLTAHQSPTHDATVTTLTSTRLLILNAQLFFQSQRLERPATDFVAHRQSRRPERQSPTLKLHNSYHNPYSLGA